MLLQLNWRFWLCVVVIFVLVRLRTTLRPSTWFGILNFTALALLLGVQGAALIFGLACFVWGAGWISRRSGSLVAQVSGVGAMAVGLLLIVQKIVFEVGAPSSLTPYYNLLEVVSYAYVALRIWDVLAAINDGEYLLNPVALTGYIAPFFMMPAGPINVYREHLEIDHSDTFAPPTWETLLRGIELIAFGLFMKFVLGELLRLYFVGVTGSWPTGSYLDSLVTFFYVYLDFAGYSLIALGIGRLLGVPTPINFDRPLLSTSLTEFWARWHMSLGNWVKRNIYFPLQLFFLRRAPDNAIYLINTLSLMAGFTFVGLWHRMTLPFLLWGLAFGCVLSLEKGVRDRVVGPLLKRYPQLAPFARVLGPFYTIGVVVAMLHLTVMGQMIGAVERE